MNFGTVQNRREGFTLLELLVAIFIFTMIVGTIYYTLVAGIEAFQKGEKSMEQYQSIRIGLARMAKELRQAVSPESPWSNLAEDERRGRFEPVRRREIEELERQGRYDEEEIKENDIKFVGDSRQVTFVVSEVVPGGDPVFDLREVRYSVDSEEKMLIREIVGSIVEKRMWDWRSLRSENETEFRIQHSAEMEFEPIREEVTPNVADMELRYFDGFEWREQWDSNQIVEEERYDYDYDYAPEEQTNEDWLDEEPERLGLPHAVEVILTMENGQAVRTVTEVPAKDVDRMHDEEQLRISGYVQR